MRRVRASAAASLSNLGPGYDVLGLCLSGPRDIVEAELTEDGAVHLVEVTGDAGRLPREPDQNCAGVAAMHVLKRFGGGRRGVRLWLHKGLPLGSGLGSSGASAVAAAVATATLVAPEHERRNLLEACREGERLATGAAHPDNVAPSLLGGFVAAIARPTTTDPEAVEVIELPLGCDVHIAAVKPAVEVQTAHARAVLPSAIPLEDVVSNLGAIAGLVSGLGQGDLELVGRCMTDRIATPYRSALIPGYPAVQRAALAAGAPAFGISGSGPTVFTLCASRADATRAAAAMTDAFHSVGLEALAIVDVLDRHGAQVEVLAH